MISKEILQKIKQIEIHTKRLVSGSLIGDARSAQKGTGLEFDQIRDYQMGDDVRFIDWKSSARMNKLLLKQYFEERNRTIILLVDGSSSSFYSSAEQLKYTRMAEIASVLALVATYGKDHVGLLLFTDTVKKVIPPVVGKHHCHKMMETLFSFQTNNYTATNISCALEYLGSLKLKNALVFIVSDFIDQEFEKPLSVMAKKHDLVAIRCLDKNELQLPSIGLIDIQDIETGKKCTIDLRSNQQKKIQAFLHDFVKQQNMLFNKYGIDSLQINPSGQFMRDLVQFFRRRMRY